MEVQELRNQLEREKGALATLERQVVEADIRLRGASREEKQWEKALAIIQTVAQQTQEELVYHLSDIVTTALAAVFPDPYSFAVEFNIQRGRTEAVLLFERDGHRMSPLEASGYGAVDMASFALRVAVWSLAQPRSRNVMVLDEPFKHLSRNLHSKASLILKELSSRLDLQIIMVSHSEELIEGANKVFKVSISKGISKVVEG